MRLFVAIQFTKPFKDRLLDLGSELRKRGLRGSYTNSDKLHMTLCFIGEVSEAKPVISALSELEFRPFELELTELGIFRDLLWVGTRENAMLRTLVHDIRTALDGAGISYDKKAFKPHITLVRRMEGEKPVLKPPMASMKVEGFALMNSGHVDGKLTYTEIAVFGLKGEKSQNSKTPVHLGSDAVIEDEQVDASKLA